MKKIAIITCHNVYNYGASLQAFALQKYLENLGNEVKIIDYQPEYLSTAYNFWNLPYGASNEKFRRNIILHFLLSIRMIPQRFSTWRRIIPFVEFKKKELKCTSKYKSFNQLLEDCPYADLYIAGSDQIWNTFLHNGRDPAFYLAFVAGDQKKISYAASFAMPKLPECDREFVKLGLSNLDAISVRESTGLDILSKLGENGELVADPVFLLTKDDWKDIVSHIQMHKENYILVYCLRSTNKIIFEKAEEISQKTGKRIIIVEGIQRIRNKHVVVKDAGPLDFISLVRDSSYVVTDSFHGTAFSVLFEKPFYVHHEHADKSRIYDLLQVLGVPDYLNSDAPFYSFDWRYMKDKLEALIAHSKSFLNYYVK